MKYAVIKTGGKQYKVSEGEEVLVEKIDAKKNEAVVFDEVLLLVDKEKVEIGQPLIKRLRLRLRL